MAFAGLIIHTETLAPLTTEFLDLNAASTRDYEQLGA